MSDKFIMSVRQASELDFAFERNGWSPVHVKTLSSADMLARILPVLLGHAEISVIKHVIDLDADPLIPYEGWAVEKHIKGGKFEWDPTKVKLFLSKNQINGKTISGNKLREEVEGKGYNANLLDYLMDHPLLIPEDWKKDENGKTRYIYFWDTIYHDSDGYLYVRYLYWGGGHWRTYCHWLGGDWGGSFPAALRAS